MTYAFPPDAQPSVAIAGRADRFPVRRIYCVGRNYAAHAREMGSDPSREPPFFFSKPANSIVTDGADAPYPPRTRNLHHEVELVVAIGGKATAIPVDRAESIIFGYAVGNDLTRRDLQAEARDDGRPWDTAKGFDHAAPVSAIHPVETTGPLNAGRIWLSVNGTMRQEADISDLTWSVPEIIAELSTFYTLQPGDLIFTGTPDGVGPVGPGDVMDCGIDGLDTLRTRIV